MNLFNALTEAMSAGIALSLFASFVWGILSVVLSPCHLSSIPLVIGYISNRQEKNVKQAFFHSLVFSLGILLSILLIGIITGLMGRLLGNIGPWANFIVSAFLIVMGLYLLGVIRLPDNNLFQKMGMKHKGYGGAFLIGLVFGIGLGPCTFAFLAPVLGIIFASTETSFVYSIGLILSYAVGHTLVIVLAGTFIEWVKRYIKKTENGKGIMIIKKICGVLIILGGVYFFIDAINKI